MKFRRGMDYHRSSEEEGELSWQIILPQMIREYSIKINNENWTKIEKFRMSKEAYVFEFIYKTERTIQEYVSIEDMFSQRGERRNDVDISTLETIPHREYISDVVDYYRLAFSSVDPYIQYISFYHIMEYFYDEVFKKKIVEDLMDKITHPDFSYKNEEKVYEIATFIKNRMHMNDAEGVYTHMAKRIYYVRNSLIHSKSGKNKERYKPYKDEKFLQKEIPLVRVVAEMIIVNSSKII